MVKISSGSTSFHKKVFPIIWFGFLVVFVAIALSQGELRDGQWPFLAVNTSTNGNLPRVTLRLVKPGRFGSEISFALPARFSFNPFAKHPVVEDLIVRVDKARRTA